MTKWVLPKRRHLGSTIAIILGILITVSSLGKIQESSGGGGLQSGPIAIIGALAYRSAKKSKYWEVKPTTLTKVMEGLAIVLILLHFVFIKRIYFQNEPLDSLVIPLWALVAYLIINLKKEKPTST